MHHISSSLILVQYWLIITTYSCNREFLNKFSHSQHHILFYSCIFLIGTWRHTACYLAPFHAWNIKLDEGFHSIVIGFLLYGISYSIMMIGSLEIFLFLHLGINRCNCGLELNLNLYSTESLETCSNIALLRHIICFGHMFVALMSEFTCNFGLLQLLGFVIYVCLFMQFIPRSVWRSNL